MRQVNKCQWHRLLSVDPMHDIIDRSLCHSLLRFCLLVCPLIMMSIHDQSIFPRVQVTHESKSNCNRTIIRTSADDAL